MSESRTEPDRLPGKSRGSPACEGKVPATECAGSAAGAVSASEALTSVLAGHAASIDHVAIAVRDLETAVEFYSTLGFAVQSRLETRGARTGMMSAVMTAGPVTFVLLEGTSPESQVSRYVENYGPGVQHVAIAVEDIEHVCAALEEAGLDFQTDLIEAPDLRQRFTTRCPNSGMMLEIIERMDNPNFSEDSVEKLFRQLEQADSY